MTHYASGWPIALAEAACDGDEACLTLLADCGPGAYGTCTAEVATCARFERGGLVMQTLCMRQGRPDDSRITLPRQDDWIIVRDTAGQLHVNGDPADVTASGCMRVAPDDRPVQDYCVTPVLDRQTLDAWAVRPLGK